MPSCKSCQIPLPPLTKTGRPSRRTSCQACGSARHYASHAAAIIAKSREWQAAHPDKRRANNARWEQRIRRLPRRPAVLALSTYSLTPFEEACRAAYVEALRLRLSRGMTEGRMADLVLKRARGN